MQYYINNCNFCATSPVRINRPNSTVQYNYECSKFINKYNNKATIDKAIETNPNIKQILQSHGLPVDYHLELISDIEQTHLIPCCREAQNMCEKLGYNKNSKEYKEISQAALLHDIGKIFIPKEILNKNGPLTKEERAIVSLHAQLGYEVLKTTDLSEEVCEMVKNHHNPGVDSKGCEIVKTADKYSALREKRPYKNALSDMGAKAILRYMGVSNKTNPDMLAYI